MARIPGRAEFLPSGSLLGLEAYSLSWEWCASSEAFADRRYYLREFGSLTLLGSCVGHILPFPVTSGQCWSSVLPNEVGLRLRRWGEVAKRTRVAVAPSPLRDGDFL